MNDPHIFDLPEIEQETKHILSSLQTRHHLLESLNQRIKLLKGGPQQKLQDWIDDLKQQQIDDLETYKLSLLFSSQGSQFDMGFPVIEEQDSTFSSQNSWVEQFADEFVEFLEIENSPLSRIWLGRKYNYPIYIGFDIRRLLDDFEFFEPKACWLAVFLREDRQIFVGFHTRHPYCYQKLESEKWPINFEFRQEFGRNLGWKPGQDISKIITLAGVYGDEHDRFFPNLRNLLERLDEIFRVRLEDIF